MYIFYVCLFDILVFCSFSLNFPNFPGSYHWYIFVAKLFVLCVTTPEKKRFGIVYILCVKWAIISVPYQFEKTAENLMGTIERDRQTDKQGEREKKY